MARIRTREAKGAEEAAEAECVGAAEAACVGAAKGACVGAAKAACVGAAEAVALGVWAVAWEAVPVGWAAVVPAVAGPACPDRTAKTRTKTRRGLPTFTTSSPWNSLPWYW